MNKSVTKLDNAVNSHSRLGWKIRRSSIRLALSGRSVNFDNLFQNDNVAIFPAIGVIFNRVKKAGNTSQVAFFDELDRAKTGNKTVPNSIEALKSGRRPHAVPITAIPKLSGFATLVTVRNPYHRTISGFLDKIATGTNPRYAEYPCFGDSSVQGFETFLQACKQQKYFGNRHFFPQTQLLFQPAERFSKIAKIESLVVDMSAFLVELGYPAGTADPLAMPHDIERNEANKIQKSTEKEHYLSAKAIDLIDTLYHADFATFGYDHRAK